MTGKVYGPGFMWVGFDDLVDGCFVDVCIGETARGWAITDLCISLAPPETVRPLVEYDSWPRLSGFAVYDTDDIDTIRGITSKHLKAIKLDMIRQEVAADLDTASFGDADWDLRIEQIADSMRTGRRQRRDDLWYANVAAVYVDVTRETRRGIYQEMSERIPLASSSLVDAVKEARKRGILSRPIDGRAGGSLTDKAIELLERNGR